MKPMKDSEILRKARRLVELRHERRICYAIETIGARHYAEAQADALTNWIAKMLEKHCFYEDWLIQYHPEVAAEYRITSIDHEEKLRPGRLAWLDWMIAECEKEEAK